MENPKKSRTRPAIETTNGFFNWNGVYSFILREVKMLHKDSNFDFNWNNYYYALKNELMLLFVACAMNGVPVIGVLE